EDVPFRGRDGTAIPGTLRDTYRCLSDVTDLDDLAERRGLTARTVANHVAQLVSHGLVDDISPWAPESLVVRVARLNGDGPIAALKPLFIALNEEASYEQLTIIRA